MAWILEDARRRMAEMMTAVTPEEKAAVSSEDTAVFAVKEAISTEKKLEEEKAGEGNEQSVDTAEEKIEELGTDELPSINAVELAQSAGKFAAKMFSYAMESADVVMNVVEKGVEQTILGDFGREQEAFLAELERKKIREGAAPWDDLPDVNMAKKQILALSLDTRNLLRDPPSETKMCESDVTAMAGTLLKLDPNLAKARFQLVPKQLSEDKFWRNYFYRVSLIRQTLLAKSSRSSGTSSASPIPTAASTSEVASSVANAAVDGAEGENAESAESNEAHLNNSAAEGEKEDAKTKIENGSLKTQEEEKEKSEKAEQDWEADVLSDLNEYELINERAGKSDAQWEEEINELLKSADA